MTPTPTFKQYFKRKYPTKFQVYNKLYEYNEGDVDWINLTDTFLDGFADWLKDIICSNSARNYFSILNTLLDTAHKAGYSFQSTNYRDLLKAKSDKVAKTWLTEKDLKLIEEYVPQNDTELAVKTKFLIGAYTGARQSDFMMLNQSNIVNGKFEYISTKTNTKATIPIKPLVLDLINIETKDVSLVTFIDTIRKICKKCGINKQINILKGGKHYKGEKWEYVTSHTARISFATNMYLLGCDIITISKMMGHSNSSMTERYIVCDTIDIPTQAMKYFK